MNLDALIKNKSLNWTDLLDTPSSIIANEFVRGNGAGTDLVQFDLFGTSNIWTADQTFDSASLLFGVAPNVSIAYDTINLVITPNVVGTGALQTVSGRIHQTTRVTDNYAADSEDENIYCNTDGGNFTLTLPVGVDGTKYRIINTGSINNNLTINPNGAELLLGLNSGVILQDGNVLIIIYETTEGWY